MPDITSSQLAMATRQSTEQLYGNRSQPDALYALLRTNMNLEPASLRARCTNVVQLWTRVKSEFEPSSGVNCVAPKRFKRWSPFNSELPCDHESNFDLGSTRSYACALCNKYLPWYYCCKKLPDSNLILSKKFPRIKL